MSGEINLGLVIVYRDGEYDELLPLIFPASGVRFVRYKLDVSKLTDFSREELSYILWWLPGLMISKIFRVTNKIKCLRRKYQQLTNIFLDALVT